MNLTSAASSISTPALPPHCSPTNKLLETFSSTFHVCVPTPLAFVSNTFGILSIISWLFSQLPQIYKNWSVSSVSGLSFFFLVEWCLGDLCNLLGALFTHQASWQVAIGSYYVFVDLCLVSQWVWYKKLAHGKRLRRMLRREGGTERRNDWPDGSMRAVDSGLSNTPAAARESGDTDSKSKKSAEPTRPKIIFHTPTFETRTRDADEKPSSSLSTTPRGTAIYRIGGSSPLPSPSPRTVLLIACLAALLQVQVQASPLHNDNHNHHDHPSSPDPHPTPLENAGTAVSWLSTILYLASRLPQLIKNWRRQSTSGLSPQLFIAAFCGNSFYSLALLTNPLAWHDYGAYGGHGWAPPVGSNRAAWVAAALPFFLGAAGVLGLDASVGVQFMMYGERDGGLVVVVDDEGKDQNGRWRRVSGWMRGWVPSSLDDSEGSVVGEDGEGERRGLLDSSSGGGSGQGQREDGGYGGL